MALKLLVFMAILQLAICEPVPDPDPNVDVRVVQEIHIGEANSNDDEIGEANSNDFEAEGSGGGSSRRRGCLFASTSYFSGDLMEESCFKIRCEDGKWIYIGEIKDKCGECYVHGEPHFNLYSSRDLSNVITYGGTGTYAISQYRFANVPTLGVFSEFKACYAKGLSCVTSAIFKHGNVKITMTLPDLVYTNDCNEKNPGTPPPGLCQIEVRMNDKQVPLDKTGQMNEFDSILGPVLVFKHNHIKSTDDLNCWNVVGYEGFSVSLCQHKHDYAWLYVWAMPKLQNDIYGLCDTFPGTDYIYTTRSKDTVNDYAVSANSWKVNGIITRSVTDDFAAMREVDYRCNNTNVESQIQDQCNQTMKVCQVHTGPFYDACVFDLCRVENTTRYLEGYASHVLFHKQLSPSAPKCSCTFRTIIDIYGNTISAGCAITKAVPWALIACRCSLVEWIPGFCIGTVVLCKDENSHPCFYPGTGKPSCEQGDGNCGGYPIYP